MKLEILDLAVVMNYSFYFEKNEFKYLLHVQYQKETPYYLSIDKTDAKKMFNKFKFSSKIISNQNLRYRIYKPVK